MDDILASINAALEKIEGLELNPTLDDFVAYQNKLIRSVLEHYGWDATVVDEVQHRDADDFKDDLIFANPIGNNLVIELLSSEGTQHDGRAVRYVIYGESLKEGFYVNEEKGQLGTDFFYIAEEGKIVPIHTNKPVLISGMKVEPEKFPYKDVRVPERLHLNAVELEQILSDKYSMKDVSGEIGIETARDYRVEHTEERAEEKLERIVDGFAQVEETNDFVIKPRVGIGGKDVKLFPSSATLDARIFGKKLLYEQKDILIEERLVPTELRDEEDDLLDWNVRALVTFEDEPQWIGGMVRHKKWGYDPVNVCQRAQVSNLEEVLDKVGIPLERVKEQALENTRRLRDYARQNGISVRGNIGYDLIVQQDRVTGEIRIPTIEINGMLSGGVAAITQTSGSLVDSMRDVFLPSIGTFLEENERVSGELDLVYLEKSKAYVLNITDQLLENNQLRMAKQMASSLSLKYPTDLDVLRMSAKIHGKTKDYLLEEMVCYTIAQHPDATTQDKGNYGVALLKQGRFREAQDVFESIESDDDSGLDVLYDLISVCDELKDTDGANQARVKLANHPKATDEDRIESARELLKGDEDAKENAKLIIDVISDDARVSKLILLANYHFRKAENGTAKEIYETLVGLPNCTSLGHAHYALFLENQGRLDDALESIDTAISLAEDQDLAIEAHLCYKHKGDMLVAKEAFDDAIACYDSAKKTNSGLKISKEYADCYFGLGEYDLAIQYTLAAVDEFPNDWPSHTLELLTILAERGTEQDLADADQLLRDAIDDVTQDDSFSELTKDSFRFNYATLRVSQGDNAQPHLAVISSIIDKYPNNKAFREVYEYLLE